MVKKGRARSYFITFSAALTFLFVGYNLYSLQIKNTDIYLDKVRAQNLAAGYLNPKRGDIYFTDKGGEKIQAALTKEYKLIYAVPAEVKDPIEASEVISQALDLDKAELLTALSNKKSKFYALIKRATEEQEQVSKELSAYAVYIKSEKARFYPFGFMAAHVLGIVGLTSEDDAFRGRYGIELLQDGRLAGVSGRVVDGKVVEPKDGENIFTTIDRNVQAHVEKVLDDLFEKYSPSGGTIIVQEPKTGKVVAMASRPGFDPNSYSDYDLASLKNPAVEAVYEPGSIFKVITMAAGLDSGKITPQTVYHDTGEVVLNSKKIKNWDLKAHGDITMTNVIEKSVNTGAVFAQRQTGDSVFYDYLVKFGFKEKTGIDLPGEVVGSLSPLEKNQQPINFATASFGQGVSVTPLRLLTAISAIANGGVMRRPYFTEFSRSQEERRVISREAAMQVAQMMVSAVDKAQVAKIPNYHVAGKTGTAQIPSRGGYLDFSEGVIHSYAGFAPAYSPVFSVLIKIDKPKGADLAGQTVVPAFKEITEFLLNYYNVSPTR